MPTFVDIDKLDSVSPEDINLEWPFQVSGTQKITLQQIVNLVNKNLTLKAGTNSKTYTGEKPVTFEVTRENLGAAKENHTHTLSEITNHSTQGVAKCIVKNELFDPESITGRWDYDKVSKVEAYGPYDQNTSKVLNLGYRVMGMDGFIDPILIKLNSNGFDIEGKLWIYWSFDALYIKCVFQKLEVTMSSGTTVYEKLNLNINGYAEAIIDDRVKPDITKLSNFLLPSYETLKVGTYKYFYDPAIGMLTTGAMIGHQLQILEHDKDHTLQIVSVLMMDEEGKLTLHLGIHMLNSDTSGSTVVHMLNDKHLVHIIPLGIDYICRYDIL